ncbi:MAG: hypothetical protein CM15mV42_1080 [uncultured marine virus]|nr:MAG: hypothetical protein CM15mV42_1080 [uncultured marine virus]
MTLASDYGVRIYRRVLSVDENGMPDKHEVIREDVWERMSNKPDYYLILMKVLIKR